METAAQLHHAKYLLSLAAGLAAEIPPRDLFRAAGHTPGQGVIPVAAK